MHWTFWEFWGLAAGCISIGAVALQIIKGLRTRDLRALSAPMFAMFSLSISLWLIYGIAHGLPSMIFVNSVLLLENLTILFLKRLFRNEHPNP